ncbi:MAG: asparagine synthase (glutamine-hydrolyzing) [Thermoanaerobaculia bacterium]
MCGISLILAGRSSAEVSERVRRMHAKIPHRGPDGEGFLFWSAEAGVRRAETMPGDQSASLAVAFRRLTVLDRGSAADQPMSSQDRSTWIVFNGEIYNYRSLREELERSGHRFRSSGDTEVVLAAYEEWGSRAFERLDGMWALAIVDLNRRELVVSRDRIGIKPLYWSLDGDRLLFASEIKQILAATDRPAVANAAVLSLYLTGWRSPCLDDTYFEGIELVPSASVATISIDEPPTAPRFEPFWQLRPESRWSDGYDAAVDELERRLTASVSTHAVADVAAGSLLSGGLDSTLLAVLMHRQKGLEAEVPTFSLGFRERAPELCELGYVDEVVARERILNHQTTFDPAWMTRRAGDMIRALEEPPLASAALAQYRIFEHVRERGVTVALDGQASDELFGGYPNHQRLVLLDEGRENGVSGFLRELGAISRKSDSSRLGVLADYFGDPILQRLGRTGAGRWVVPAYRDARRPGLGSMQADRIDDPSLLNQLLYRELRWGNVKIILLYADKNAMAHSVEARVPYLDRSLVEFAFSLPSSFKAGAGERKRVLRDVARRYLPPSITERRDRMGFATPEEQFLRESMTVVRRDVERELLAVPGAFDRRSISSFLDRFERGASRDFRGAWRLWAAALWRREFDVVI